MSEGQTLDATTLEPGAAASPTEVRYAGFWVRLLASMIDDTVVFVPSIALTLGALYAGFLVLRPTERFGEAFSGELIQVVYMIASICVSIPYYVWLHYRSGASLGKRVFGIIVVQEPSLRRITLGQSFARFLGHFVSVFTLGIGYLVAIFNPKRRALHDFMAGTVSIYASKEEIAKVYCRS